MENNEEKKEEIFINDIININEVEKEIKEIKEGDPNEEQININEVENEHDIRKEIISFNDMNNINENEKEIKEIKEEILIEEQINTNKDEKELDKKKEEMPINNDLDNNINENQKEIEEIKEEIPIDKQNNIIIIEKELEQKEKEMPINGMNNIDEIEKEIEEIKKEITNDDLNNINEIKKEIEKINEQIPFNGLNKGNEIEEDFERVIHIIDVNSNNIIEEKNENKKEENPIDEYNNINEDEKEYYIKKEEEMPINNGINNVNKNEIRHENKDNNNKQKEDQEIKIENDEDLLSQQQINKNEEGIVGNNNITNEEENNKLFGKNLDEDRTSSELNNIEEKQDTCNITGDNEAKNSSNNLDYLGNLFRDVVNKYDMESKNIQESRKLIRKTIYKKNISKETTIPEKEPINFKEIINAQLSEVKENTLSYLDKTKIELDKKYSSYIKDINKYINENELKISKVFTKFESNENFMNYADDTIFKQIDYLLEIHENIFSALMQHINLLYTFLDQIDLIKQKNPFEHFLNTNSNDILNCWFLSKIDFNKLSLSNVIINKDLSDLVSGYLCKKRENNFAKITIQKDTKGNLSLESEFLKNNINNLEKLKFLGLSSDAVNSILKNVNKKGNNNNEDNIQIGKKLHSLSIIESNFDHKELPKFSLPVLQKVKIKKSFLPLNYFFDSIVGQTSFLKKIDIQNCKLNDKDFLDFFYYLGQKKYLQDTIEFLGFSGNELTYINLKQFINKGGILKNLIYFDLSKNNIYEFVTDNFKAIPKLKVLELSDNNISNYLFFKHVYKLYSNKNISSIVLLTNNIFISNNKVNNRNYMNYINRILSSFQYKIKKINLNLIYNRDNNEELTTLKISPSVKISLLKLNLSYCGLKTGEIWKFLQNNFGLLNLVSLNLSYNFIENNFFMLCTGQDILLEKLKIIDLSMNLITCKTMNDLNQIETFINNYQKLKKIKIQRNVFIQDLNTLYEKNVENIKKIIGELKAKEVKFYIDTKYSNLVKDELKQIIEFKDKKI